MVSAVDIIKAAFQQNEDAYDLIPWDLESTDNSGKKYSLQDAIKYGLGGADSDSDFDSDSEYEEDEAKVESPRASF